jgi:hypothetical protein
VIAIPSPNKTRAHASGKLLSWHDSPLWARASSLSRLHDHTQAHHTRQNSSGRVISPTQRPLPDDTQHSQETDIHTPGGYFFSGSVCPLDPFCIFGSFHPSSCHLCSILLSLYNKHTTKILAPGGIRTHSPSKQTAADPRLRPHCHWDRLGRSLHDYKNFEARGRHIVTFLPFN